MHQDEPGDFGRGNAGYGGKPDHGPGGFWRGQMLCEVPLYQVSGEKEQHNGRQDSFPDRVQQ